MSMLLIAAILLILSGIIFSFAVVVLLSKIFVVALAALGIGYLLKWIFE